MPRNSLPPFLKKLRNITQDLDEKVACWASDGKSYEIHDLEEFKKLLKEHFKGNIQTFVRQLHFYGFRKFENEKNEFCFSHPHFRRDQPHLIFAIKRKTRGETVDTVVTNGELRGISTQINQLDSNIHGIKRDMARVFERLGFQADVGLGSYDVTKKRKMASAGSELVAVTEKQAVEQMRHTILIDKSEKFTYKKESAREQAKQASSVERASATAAPPKASVTPIKSTPTPATSTLASAVAPPGATAVAQIPVPVKSPGSVQVQVQVQVQVPVSVPTSASVKAEVSLEPEPVSRGGDGLTVGIKEENPGVSGPST